MNANPGGAQRHLQDTVILLNNPPPKPGHPDMCGQPQSTTYPSNYPNPALQGKAKGLKAVLNEHELAWDEMIVKNGGKWSVGKCKECKKSQSKKDVEQKVAEAEAMGQEDTLEDNDIVQAEEPEVAESPISYCQISDGKFPTAQRVIPKCLNMCDTLTICWFFCKSWCYMDAYCKGLDPVQTAFTVKQFKSHCKVGIPAEIKQLLAERELLLAQKASRW